MRYLLPALWVLAATGCSDDVVGDLATADVDGITLDAFADAATAPDAPATPDTAPPDVTGDAAPDAAVDAAPDLPATDVAGPTESRCLVDGSTMTCDHQTETLWTGFTGLIPREVHWQIPTGAPPPAGWPAVFIFQGSLFTAELFWWVVDVDVIGMWNQGQVTKTLLDNGYAVITPEAHGQGATAWDTNIPPMSLSWGLAGDHAFMLDIFAAMDAGTFGSIDASRVYATGISSGGYMSSRVALEYPDRFRAIAINAASYMTCAGAICSVPDDLPAAHQPTLFLHGSADLIVPMASAELYHDALVALGVTTDFIVEEGTGHAWIDASPTAILQWFESH